jgi:hypothetical protein
VIEHGIAKHQHSIAMLIYFFGDEQAVNDNS